MGSASGSEYVLFSDYSQCFFFSECSHIYSLFVRVIGRLCARLWGFLGCLGVIGVTGAVPTQTIVGFFGMVFSHTLTFRGSWSALFCAPAWLPNGPLPRPLLNVGNTQARWQTPLLAFFFSPPQDFYLGSAEKHPRKEAVGAMSFHLQPKPFPICEIRSTLPQNETLCFFRSLFLCTNNSGAEPARFNRGLKAPGGTLEVRSPDSGPCPRFKSSFIQMSAVISAHGFPFGCFCFPLAAQGVARAILLTRRPTASCRLTWACVGNRFGLRGRLFVSLGAFIS